MYFQHSLKAHKRMANLSLNPTQTYYVLQAQKRFPFLVSSLLPSCLLTLGIKIRDCELEVVIEEKVKVQEYLINRGVRKNKRFKPVEISILIFYI